MDKKKSKRIMVDGLYNYDVPIKIPNLAIWEKYIPYVRSKGFFEEIKNIFGISSKAYLDRGLLSSGLRTESLYNNLYELIKLRSSQKRECFRVVECGVGVNRSTKVMISLMNKSDFQSKSYCVYDTFSGLPSSPHDQSMDNNIGLYSTSIEEFNSLFSQYNFVTAIKGLIPHTLPKDDKNNYDFIHIDLDLYEGTHSSLQHFFPRLNNRGIIQLDDYNNFPWTGVNDAVDQFLYGLDRDSYFFSQLPLGGAFIIKLK